MKRTVVYQIVQFLMVSICMLTAMYVYNRWNTVTSNVVWLVTVLVCTAIQVTVFAWMRREPVSKDQEISN